MALGIDFAGAANAAPGRTSDTVLVVAVLLVALTAVAEFPAAGAAVGGAVGATAAVIE